MVEWIENAIYNQEAEQSVIGSILLEGELIKECILQPKHFYFKHNQILMDKLQKIDVDGKPIDLVIVSDYLANNDLLNEIGGISYLSNLANSVPTTANFNHYQNLVLNHSKMRLAIQEANKLKSELQETKDIATINTTVNNLMQIDEQGLEDDFNMRKTLTELHEEMETEVDGLTGVPTGFVDLDRITNGWQQQDLVVIGARPSMGKTAFALNLAQHACEKGNAAVGVFSLEMGEKMLLRRKMCAMENIDATKMRNPRKFFTQSDWDKSANAIGRLENMDLFIYDKPGVTTQEIYTKCRKLRQQHKDQKVLIIIDYLQLIVGNPKHGGNRTQEISEISRMLKIMARELDITVIALSQLSRGVEQRQDKRPMMSDLRESGQIEQDADIIGFLYRDDYYEKESENKNITEIIISKQRNGPIGVVELAFIKEFSKFVNLDIR